MKKITTFARKFNLKKNIYELKRLKDI